MNRCVVIHRNGTSEVQDVQPLVHKKLRGLEYRRFVVEFARDKDGLSVTSALYSKLTPSSWQVENAVRQLWGRGTGAIRVFDEDGELLQSGPDVPPDGASGAPAHDGSRASPASPPSPMQSSAPTTSAPTVEATITLHDIAELRRAAVQLGKTIVLHDAGLSETMRRIADALESALPPGR